MRPQQQLWLPGQVFSPRLLILFLIIFTFAFTQFGQERQTASPNNPIPISIMRQILSAEDQRRWDTTLASLFNNSRASVRIRAALAAGRIGNDEAVGPLSLLLKDQDEQVRAMAAFALGEIESAKGADVLVTILRDTAISGELRARSVEALGKIAAALPSEQEARMRELGAVILETLRFEADRKSALQRETILLGLTAALRSRPANAGSVLAGFLRNRDPRIRTDAANALARLRAREGNEELREILTSDVDPVVRANAARVLGATEDKSAFDVLLDRTFNDNDSRVRISAIRSLAQLRDPRAGDSLLKRGGQLLATLRDEKARRVANPAVQNEILEVATTLGRLLPLQTQPGLPDQKTIHAFFSIARDLIEPWAPEVELAFVRALPGQYVAAFGSTATSNNNGQRSLHWRAAASVAQALGETPSLPETVANKSELTTRAEQLLRSMLDGTGGPRVQKAFKPEYAKPEMLRALAAFKPKDLAVVLRRHLNHDDVVVRGTAADLLGDLPASDENTDALIAALPRAQRDELNDAVLSILDSLGKQKTSVANEAIKRLLDSKDHLVRRRAATLLKANGAGDFSMRIGPVQSSNTPLDYERALARTGGKWRAVVTTTKGSFTIELLPSDAPLTVDNFVRLAQRGYYGGVTVHRVVPNFVIQDGDPRGDGNGGPGYQIRCEINQVPYERAAVGMALSGKDTGGSQWFVTHSPQPHLDGGYTVFGRVIAGMDVVDSIVRGDQIRSITIRRG
jgi:cyclophilin family peptidyl-prolyl cis-trans isomerase/HEAT repeat protein